MLQLVRELPTALPLVASNLIPLAGVAFWGWRLGTVMVLYWIDNGILGALNVPRMALSGIAAERRQESTRSRHHLLARLGGMSLIPYFILLYGAFWVFHGEVVLVLFGGISLPDVITPAAPVRDALTTIDWQAVTTGVIGLLLYNLVSFAYWDVYRHEYAELTQDEAMVDPFPRAIVLQAVIIFGGIVVARTGEPIVALILLVVLKITLDLVSQLALSGRTSVAPPAFAVRLARPRRR